jgi:DNA-binding NtrC family response regulator
MNDNAPAETILIVADEVFVRTGVAQYLRGCGYKVIESSSADEALTVLQSATFAVDVVFCDITVPGTKDGFGLSTWIKSNRPELDVILTGSLDGTVDAATDLCEDGPISKPYEHQAVLDRIRRLRGLRKR